MSALASPPPPAPHPSVAFHYSVGATILAWGPLGGDGWAGANRLFKVGSPDDSQRNARVHSGLKTVAALLGDSEDVIAIAWLLRHPSRILPILGTMNPQRLANQTRAVAVAAAMTSVQWYHISDAAGVRIW